MSLPKFEVTGNLYDIPGLNADGELVTRACSDSVTFTPNLNPDEFFTWAGGLYRTPRPVGVAVNPDGSISDLDHPVLLLDNDTGLNIAGIQWRVDVGRTSWWFTAPGDGSTVDLATVSRVPSAQVNAVAGATISEIIAEINDPNSALRLALEGLGISGGSGANVDGGTPLSGSGSGNIDGGTP